MLENNHTIHLTLNGESRAFTVKPQETLLHVLRERAHLTGAKKGCDLGECGACTVIMDGRAVNSCCVFAIEALVGAGFGARQQLHAQHAAALISRKIKRPVKLLYSREEDFYSVVRHASDVDLRIGADKNGKLQLFDTTFRLNAGPYTTHMPTVVAAAARKLQYNVPNYSFIGLSVFTNHVTGGAFRGYGNTQLTFGREILMDRLAQKLDMDPVEFRLMNHVQVGECFPCASIPVSSNGIEDCARRCQQIQKEIDEVIAQAEDELRKLAMPIKEACMTPAVKRSLYRHVAMLLDLRK